MVGKDHHNKKSLPAWPFCNQSLLQIISCMSFAVCLTVNCLSTAPTERTGKLCNLWGHIAFINKEQTWSVAAYSISCTVCDICHRLFNTEIGNTRSVVRVRQSVTRQCRGPLVSYAFPHPDHILLTTVPSPILFPRQLIYTGQLDLGDANRPAGVRSCVHTACSHNAAECLKEMGCL